MAPPARRAHLWQPATINGPPSMRALQLSAVNLSPKTTRYRPLSIYCGRTKLPDIKAGSNYREVNSLRNVQAYTVYRECSIHMKKALGTINQRQGWPYHGPRSWLLVASYYLVCVSVTIKEYLVFYGYEFFSVRRRVRDAANPTVHLVH